ncbi:MAG TPA: hypothetical protein VLT59_05285, partial [Steroidobacteraceae bacterium]|nr:hypothetical protein [Steroidobacteraceae bacterium]
MTIPWYPVMFHTVDRRSSTIEAVNMAADRFEKVNGRRPQIVTRETEPAVETNPYWYPIWVWDYIPEDVEYVLCMDSKVLAVRPLPELPEVEFAAVMDRQDRII